MSKRLKYYFIFIILIILLLLGRNTVNAGTTLVVTPEAGGNPKYTLSGRWIGNNYAYIFTIENLQPNNGYELDSVTVNGRSVTVTDNVGVDTSFAYRDPTWIYVNYNLIDFNVNFEETNVTISGPETINIEEINTYTVTPKEGYSLTEVIVGTENILNEQTDKPFTFDVIGEDISDDVTITANAELINYNIIINDGENSSNNADFKTMTIEDTKEIIIAPQKGYKLMSVKINGVSQFDEEKEETYTVTLSGINEDQIIDVTTKPIEIEPIEYNLIDEENQKINVEKDLNPQTGDNIIMILLIFGISSIGIFILNKRYKKL